MRLIIDIDDEMVCNDIKNKALEPTSETDEVIINALYNGTPYNPSGDLISRTELKKCAIPCEIHNGALTDLCVPLYQIDNAPTVEPDMDFAKECYANGYEDGKNERPQGEWKETGYETGALGITYRQTQCSNCGWEHALPVWYSFCPNCGANMGDED